MNDFTVEMIYKYRNKGLLTDTNLLLLYFIGSVNRDFVEKFKRTGDRFTVEDFDTVSTFIEFFEVKVTTPHILTEVSNFIGNIDKKMRESYFDAFAKSFTIFDEKYLPSLEIGSAASFNKFGLTDSAIGLLAKDSFLVFTDDLPLYHYLSNSGIDVINYNHIRNI